MGNYVIDDSMVNLIEKYNPNIANAIRFDCKSIETEFEEYISISRLITKEQRYAVLKRQKWLCNSCGIRLKYNKNSKWEGEIAHIDHIHPYAERFYYPNGAGKINEDSNLQALCGSCNKKKGRKKA